MCVCVCVCVCVCATTIYITRLHPELITRLIKFMCTACSHDNTSYHMQTGWGIVNLGLSVPVNCMKIFSDHQSGHFDICQEDIRTGS